MKINGKSIIVTGASQGLGRALALELAGKGAKLTLAARHASALTEVVELIRSRGGQAMPFAEDVAGHDAPARLVGLASAWAGPVDVLINNASTLGALPLPLLQDTQQDDFRRVLEVNLVAPFLLTKAVLGQMLLRKETGIVINLSSDAAVEPYPTWGGYGASKAALDHLTRIFAAETSGSDVHFFAVDPGEMNTRMHADAMPDADPLSLESPESVAHRIVAELVERHERFQSGARVCAANLGTQGGQQ